jgi:hypothetical protein
MLGKQVHVAAEAFMTDVGGQETHTYVPGGALLW